MFPTSEIGEDSVIVEGGYQRNLGVLCCLSWGRVKGDQTICGIRIFRSLNRDLVEADSPTDFLIGSEGGTEKEIGIGTETGTGIEIGTETEIGTGTEMKTETGMKTGKETGRMGGMMIEGETLIEIERGGGEVEGQGVSG